MKSLLISLLLLFINKSYSYCQEAMVAPEFIIDFKVSHTLIKMTYLKNKSGINGSYVIYGDTVGTRGNIWELETNKVHKYKKSKVKYFADNNYYKFKNLALLDGIYVNNILKDLLLDNINMNIGQLSLFAGSILPFEENKGTTLLEVSSRAQLYTNEANKSFDERLRLSTIFLKSKPSTNFIILGSGSSTTINNIAAKRAQMGLEYLIALLNLNLPVSKQFEAFVDLSSGSMQVNNNEILVAGKDRNRFKWMIRNGLNTNFLKGNNNLSEAIWFALCEKYSW